MRVLIETYGCSMNFADSQFLAGFLKQNGITLLGSEDENPELIIFNGCSVKGKSESRMLSRLNRLSMLSRKKGFSIAVFGCLAKTSEEKIRAISSQILFFRDFRELALHFSKGAENTENESLYFDFEPIAKPGPSIIPINSGCLNSCTFCSVKKARGNLHSFPMESIARRFARAIKTSNEIWLTSQDTGAYGFDIGSSLPELLKGLLSNDGDFRIRVGMANPWHFKRIEKKLVPLFEDERLYRFLHIPLQSGSDRILSLMARGYTTEYWLGLVNRLRASIPNLTVSTDIIAGFPGETEEEFGQTLDALGSARPDLVNVSRYSPRPGTIASEMPNQLGGGTKRSRSRIVSMLARKISLENSIAQAGKTERVLISEQGRKGGMIGRTGSYRQVMVREAEIGEFLEVKIKGASLGCLFGERLGAKSGQKTPIVNAFNKV